MQESPLEAFICSCGLMPLSLSCWRKTLSVTLKDNPSMPWHINWEQVNLLFSADSHNAESKLDSFDLLDYEVLLH